MLESLAEFMASVLAGLITVLIYSCVVPSDPSWTEALSACVVLISLVCGGIAGYYLLRMWLR